MSENFLPAPADTLEPKGPTPNQVALDATDPIPSPVAAVDAPPVPLDGPATSLAAKPSYVKLAMRNMVRKGGTSLFHFALTTVGLLTLLVGLAYLTH